MLVRRSSEDGLAGDKARRVKGGNFLGRCFLGSFLVDGDHNHHRVVGFMERFKGASAKKNNI